MLQVSRLTARLGPRSTPARCTAWAVLVSTILAGKAASTTKFCASCEASLLPEAAPIQAPGHIVTALETTALAKGHQTRDQPKCFVRPRPDASHLLAFDPRARKQHECVTIPAVDDDGVAQRLLPSSLATVGYAVLGANDPGEGVSLARTNGPDLHIPSSTFQPASSCNSDGCWVTERLLRVHLLDSRPSLFITADELSTIVGRAAPVGTSAVLQPPLAPEQVLTRVTECLAPLPAAA